MAAERQGIRRTTPHEAHTTTAPVPSSTASPPRTASTRMDAEKKGPGAMGGGLAPAGSLEGIEKAGVYSPGGLENGRSGGRTAETLLRVLPIGLCVAAVVVTLHNSMSNDYGTVKYSDFSGLKYLVYANGACAAYSFFSAFYTAMPRPPTMARAWTLFCLDQILTYVVLTAAAAGTEILYLAYNGDREVTWSEACQSFGGFCVKAKASVGITFGVFLCYIGISLVSSFRLFSSYDAPVPFLSKNAGVAAFPG